MTAAISSHRTTALLWCVAMVSRTAFPSLGQQKWAGPGRLHPSHRRRAVAHVDVELVCFGRRRRRLLQHAVLHDHLLVGVDGRIGVVRVVARLVAARLIGRLRRQRLLALTAQQLAGKETETGRHFINS